MYHTGVGLIALVLPKELLCFNSWCNYPVFLPNTVAGWMPVAFIDFGGMCRWHWPLKSDQLDAKSFQNICKNNLWAAFGSHSYVILPHIDYFPLFLLQCCPNLKSQWKCPRWSPFLMRSCRWQFVACECHSSFSPWFLVSPQLLMKVLLGNFTIFLSHFWVLGPNRLHIPLDKRLYNYCLGHFVT